MHLRCHLCKSLFVDINAVQHVVIHQNNTEHPTVDGGDSYIVESIKCRDCRAIAIPAVGEHKIAIPLSDCEQRIKKLEQELFELRDSSFDH